MAAVFRPWLLLLAPAAFAQQTSAQAVGAPSPFLSVPPALSDSLRFGPQLSQFEAKDIRGKIWRSEDMLGKYTLVYIWGTYWNAGQGRRSVGWDLPELKELQRFYDKVRNAGNVQVLTFCMDYDYTHAPEYIRQTKFTFPVIADWMLIRKLFGRGNPAGGRLGLMSLIWVVDPQGRVSEPFRSWSFGRVLFEVERAAARN
ncbi:MAG TPA: hypothetical protein VME43_16965 [Bryobacteraceae bacterium]|nr:hypothetical protein [Bryobacteraceae bacterium]